MAIRMGKNIEDLERHKDATDDVAAERKKDPAAVRRFKDGAKRRSRKVSLDDVEDTVAAGANESMGMSQNMKEERSNERGEKKP